MEERPAANIFQLAAAQTMVTELERALRGMEASADIALAVGAETQLNRILELRFSFEFCRSLNNLALSMAIAA